MPLRQLNYVVLRENIYATTVTVVSVSKEILAKLRKVLGKSGETPNFNKEAKIRLCRRLQISSLLICRLRQVFSCLDKVTVATVTKNNEIGTNACK